MPACSDWCMLDPGHPWDSEHGNGRVSRGNRARTSETSSAWGPASSRTRSARIATTSRSTSTSTTHRRAPQGAGVRGQRHRSGGLGRGADMTTIKVAVDPATMKPNELEQVGIPRHCPSWCTKDDQQSVEEDIEPEEDLRPQRERLRPPNRGDPRRDVRLGDVALRRRPGHQSHLDVREAVHRMELHAVGNLDRRSVTRIDTGSARILATHLLHFADQADLES